MPATKEPKPSAIKFPLSIENAVEISDDLEIGDYVPGHGIYVGKWESKESRHWGLGKVFNVYAAPHDLSDPAHEQENGTFVYDDALQAVSEIKNLEGHDGAFFKRDKDFFQAVKDGIYDGEWVIPPVEILRHNVMKNASKGALKDTFEHGAHYTSSSHDYNDYYLLHTVSDTPELYQGLTASYRFPKNIRAIRMEPDPTAKPLPYETRMSFPGF